MSVLARVHDRVVFRRRVRVLADALSAVLPQDSRVLDVGCGDGKLAALIGDQRSDLVIQGVDVLARPAAAIPVDIYDGSRLPYGDTTFDAVMAVDVLHHTDYPGTVLADMTRVARTCVVLKDHLRDGVLAGARLRAMDWVGNAPHGVRLPYNYLTRAQWQDEFRRLGLRTRVWDEDVPLYPPPASWMFGGSLHFVARLEKQAR